MSDELNVQIAEAVQKRQLRLVRNAIGILALVLASFAAKDLWFGATFRTATLSVALLILLLAYFYNRAGAQKVALSLYFGAFWFCILLAAFTTGNAHTVILAWFPVLVCLAGLLGGAKYCVAWFTVSLLTVFGLWAAAMFGMHLEHLEIVENKILHTRLHLLAQLLVVAGVVLSFLDLQRYYRKQLRVAVEQLASAERTRASADASAQRAEQSKAVFLNNMSHEMRTPLNSIIGFSSRLLKSESLSDSKDRDAARCVSRNGKVLLTLVDELLELAKIESTPLHYNEQPVLLGELLRECIMTTEASARNYGLHLRLLISDDVEIRADQARLHQALVGLLYFCISQTRDGGVDIMTAKTPREQVPGVSLVVRDSSNGIAEEQLHGLFKTHYHVVLSNNRDLPVSALTLSLLAKVVELHGGAIDVTSELGQGNRFELWLPLQPPPLT